MMIWKSSVVAVHDFFQSLPQFLKALCLLMILYLKVLISLHKVWIKRNTALNLTKKVFCFLFIYCMWKVKAQKSSSKQFSHRYYCKPSNTSDSWWFEFSSLKVWSSPNHPLPPQNYTKQIHDLSKQNLLKVFLSIFLWFQFFIKLNVPSFILVFKDLGHRCVDPTWKIKMTCACVSSKSDIYKIKMACACLSHKSMFKKLRWLSRVCHVNLMFIKLKWLAHVCHINRTFIKLKWLVRMSWHVNQMFIKLKWLSCVCESCKSDVYKIEMTYVCECHVNRMFIILKWLARMHHLNRLIIQVTLHLMHCKLIGTYNIYFQSTIAIITFTGFPAVPQTFWVFESHLISL